MRGEIDSLLGSVILSASIICSKLELDINRIGSNRQLILEEKVYFKLKHLENRDEIFLFEGAFKLFKKLMDKFNN